MNPPGPNRLPIRVEYGKLMPLKEEDGKNKKKAQKKPPARKKDEKPKKPIQWADKPAPEPLSTMDLMNKARQEME